MAGLRAGLRALARAVAGRDQAAVLAALATLEPHGGYAGAVRACEVAQQPTPLHTVAAKGYTPLLAELLRSAAHGDAALDVVDASTGETAYAVACAAGRLAIVAQLVEHGCRTDVTTHRGETGWDLAQNGGHIEVLGLLRERAFQGHPALQAEQRRRVECKRLPRRQALPVPELWPEPEPETDTGPREAEPPRRKSRLHSGGETSPFRRKCTHPGCPEAWRLWPTISALEQHEQSAHSSPLFCSFRGCSEVCTNWLVSTLLWFLCLLSHLIDIFVLVSAGAREPRLPYPRRRGPNSTQAVSFRTTAALSAAPRANGRRA